MSCHSLPWITGKYALGLSQQQIVNMLQQRLHISFLPLNIFISNSPGHSEYVYLNNLTSRNKTGVNEENFLLFIIYVLLYFSDIQLILIIGELYIYKSPAC